MESNIGIPCAEMSPVDIESLEAELARERQLRLQKEAELAQERQLRLQNEAELARERQLGLQKEADLAEEQKARKSVESKLRRAESRATKYKGQRDAAQYEKKVAEGEKKKLERDCDRLLRENVRMNEAMTSLKSELQNLKQESGRLSRKLRAAERAQASADKAVVKLQDRYDTAKAQVAQEKNSTGKIKAELKEVRAELKKLRKTSGQDVKRIADLLASKKKLEAQLNKARVSMRKDHTNSGVSSSRVVNRPPVRNSTRKPSGKRPGAQEGHEPKLRKQLTDCLVASDEEVAVPDKFLDRSRYAPTDEYKLHQLQDVIVLPVVHNRRVRGYRNLRTGKIEYPVFPEGFTNDVNFSGRLKAILFMMVNRYNVSIGSTRKFLLDFSRGKMDISTGCIWKLVKEFSEKTSEERDAIFQKVAAAEMLHADFTFARTGKKLGAVLITATTDGTVLFQAREKKGLAAIPGSPLEGFEGLLISDHESTFVLHCGTLHQECLQHVLRALKEIAEQEPSLTWHRLLAEWIRKAIHYRNQVLREEILPSEEMANDFLEEFERIVAVAEAEYAPYRHLKCGPKSGYTGGVNLYKRISTKSDDYYRFLTDLRIPPTNWLPEAKARIVKRKAHQVMCFRSFDGFSYYCDAQTVMNDIIKENEDLYTGISEIFDRPSVRGKNRGKTADILSAMELDNESVIESVLRESALPSPRTAQQEPKDVAQMIPERAAS